MENITEEHVPLTAIQAAQKKLAEMREAGIKIERLSPVEKARANPSNKAACIMANCWECVGGNATEKPKLLVRDCDVGSKCLMYSVRPWQKVKGTIKEVV